MQIKDEKLLQFQQELEELIRHLHQLKLQQNQSQQNDKILHVLSQDTNQIIRTTIPSNITDTF